MLGNDPLSENAYLATSEAIEEAYGVKENPETIEARKKKWQQIKADKYFDLWYDDNAGSFLVQISIKIRDK